MTFESIFVYQVILVDPRCTKDFMNRFGIYETLEEAKFAFEYTFVDNSECDIEEAYIEKIEIGSIPDAFKRQGIKVCFLDDTNEWQWYKNHDHGESHS